MSKKKLNMEDITNELQSSAFFPNHKEEHIQEQTPASTSPSEQQQPIKPEEVVSSDTMIPRYQDTMTPRYHDTTIPLSPTVPEEDMLEAVRKMVKQVGKEPATQRLTMSEKQEIADIEFNYKKKGIKTSGNEIMRIATNYIIKDFRDNKDKSILARILEKLNS